MAILLQFLTVMISARCRDKGIGKDSCVIGEPLDF